MCKNGRAFTILGALVLVASLLLNTFYFSDIYTTLGKFNHELLHYAYKAEKNENVNFGHLMRANVYLESKRTSGSGTVIKIDKDYIYILTARHVVEHKNKIADIEVEIPTDGGFILEKVKDGDIIVDDKMDLAMLRIKYVEKHQLIVLPLATKVCYIGDTVYAVGNPLGLRDVITKGIFSAYYPNQKSPMGISCGIVFGASGGAVVNNKGELVGVISQVIMLNFNPVAYLGCAVPQKPTRDFVAGAYETFETKDAATQAVN